MAGMDRQGDAAAGRPDGVPRYRGFGVLGPLAATVVTFLVGYLQKLPCHHPGWPPPLFFRYSCYSDVPVLFRGRGLIDHK